GSIGLNDWERSNTFSSGVFLPSVSQIEQMARSGVMQDKDGFPLDQVITGSIEGKNIEKIVVWDRFDGDGKQIPNGLTD
ncbi:MAG: hypothetical protein JKX91_08995, partial [Rhizobiaceae bacterium]|nr:hypothetical protein [Rhizobiaceae bacterium]